MSNQPPADFSFDLYPGLDRELEDIYARNVANGTAPPEVIATAGLAQAVGNTLKQQPDRNLSLPARSWASIELNNNFDGGALGAWSHYEAQLGIAVPDSVEELLQNSPNLVPTIEKLHNTKKLLTDVGETNPEGLNVGETMHLVLVPWKAFRDNLDRLPEWVAEVRTAQGIGTTDFLNNNLMAALRSDSKLYRNPVYPHFFSTNGTMAPPWLSAKEYLDQKISREGPWGIMLAQTSDHAGLARIVSGPAEERSPNALTNNGNDRFKVADQNVDALGIFEWLSLTFQADPRKLSSTDLSWLLANRLEVNGGPRVPCGGWSGVHVGSSLYDAGSQDELVRPRLAVM